MNGPRERRYVVADKVVNRRTAARTAAPIAPQVRSRLAAKLSRQRMGPTLAQQLRAPASAQVRATARTVLGTVVVASGGVGLFLGWLHSSWAAVGAGAAAGLAGAAVVWRARHAQDATALALPQATPVLDEEAIGAFDMALGRVAAEVPDDVGQALAAIKARVVRICRDPLAATAGEHLTFEDRMFVRESVRRYLPDSLEAYLLVPAAQRHAAPAGTTSAHALLLTQLQTLDTALAEREAKLAADAREALLRQERFLQAKSRRL